MSSAEQGLAAQLDWLASQQRFGIRPGLERVTALLEALGHPEQSWRVVLVGGTNGKGSTAASLAAILQAAGERTGLFTSPHLIHFNERFLVNGVPVSAAALAEGLAEVRPHAERLEATFFEIVTALGCWLFARAGVETAVMEVGLGGRLDATNALNPALSILTNVSLDHTEVLGDTEAAIATEKAGILRPGRPAITGIAPQFWPLLEQTGADLWALGRDFTFQLEDIGLTGADFSLQAAGKQLSLHTPLLGVHGAQNAALAAAAALRLDCPASAIERGLPATNWPGRLEHIEAYGQSWLLDGAHNPAGAQTLAEALTLLKQVPCRFIFGASADKDVAEIVRWLAPLAESVILTQAQLSPRAALPAELRAAWEKEGVPVQEAAVPREALNMAAQGTADLPLVVCGSLYLVGECRAFLLGEAAEPFERWQ